MSDQETSGSRRESLINLVETIESAENPEKFLLELTVEGVRQKDAKLAAAIRYCAIPRRFDARIIGILREAPEDRETNDRLLAGLLSFSFVRARQSGGYVYHDNMRDMLLEDWQADDDKRSRFDQFNQRLVAFYKARHEEAQRAEQDLEEVAEVVQKASPSRYAQLASAAETRTLASLLEALYHETLRSAESGYSLFRDYYLDYEQRARLTVCESLLNAIRDYTRHHLSSGHGREALLRWLDYWKARLMLGLRRFAESETILRRLSTQVEDDTKLKLWASDDLSRILMQRQTNLREAREWCETVLALAKGTDGDSYNLPLYYSRLAGMHWGLGELDRAVEICREAIQSARENNPGMEVSAYLYLSEALQERGKWSEAFDVALEALHFARTRLSLDRALYQDTLERFMALLARRTPRLLDTLFAEYTALLTAMGDPSQALESRLRYGDLLRESAQLERAEDILAELRLDTADHADTPFGVNLLFSEGSLREDQGRLDEAIEIYTRIIGRAQDGSVTPLDHARALLSRGWDHAERALWSEAEGDLQASLEEWEEIGHEKLTALLRAVQALALGRQGRLNGAQQLLDEAHASLEEGTNPLYPAIHHQVQGDVHRYQARWREAHWQYQQAVTLYRSLGQMKFAAQNLGHLTTVAGAQGWWEEATRYTAEANDFWRRFSESARYRPSEEAIGADDENARGAQRFFAAGDDHREKMGLARELFRSACDRDPDNFWYRLNLAYACAELQGWGEAAEAVEIALERGPEWLRTPVLYERLAEYGFKQGEALFKDGDYEGIDIPDSERAVQTFSTGLRFG